MWIFVTSKSAKGGSLQLVVATILNSKLQPGIKLLLNFELFKKSEKFFIFIISIKFPQR